MSYIVATFTVTLRAKAPATAGKSAPKIYLL